MMLEQEEESNTYNNTVTQRKMIALEKLISILAEKIIN
jgi:hypothetical protein